MRCQFCGWDVPDSKGNCEKCGKPMVADSTEFAKVPKENNQEKKTSRQPAQGMENFKATLRENSIGLAGADTPKRQDTCPDCGYKMEDGICPACGYDFHTETKEDSPNIQQNQEKENMNNDAKKTMRPQRKGTMDKEGRIVLFPISETTGNTEGEYISLEGNEIVLNRENTAPKNQTITSQQQAILTHEEGKWYIVDKSELKTTFVQAARKVEIQTGDTILLGNQLYQFNDMSE